MASPDTPRPHEPGPPARAWLSDDTSEAAAWRWRGTLASGGTLEIRLVRGTLRAEPAVGEQAEVTLVRRATRSAVTAVTFAVDTSSARVHIEDRYPRPYQGAGWGAARGECLPPDDGRGDFWHSDVRTDAVVRVPPGVRLVVHLIDGNIDVRALAGPRAVITNQGTVRGVARLP